MTGLACHEELLMLKPSLSCPHNINEGENMSRFEKLTHVLWHCQYHIVWVPKYRYRVLKGVFREEVHNSIEVFCSQLRCRVVELNVQPDHVHLLVRVPPKVDHVNPLCCCQIGQSPFCTPPGPSHMQNTCLFVDLRI